MEPPITAVPIRNQAVVNIFLQMVLAVATETEEQADSLTGLAEEVADYLQTEQNIQASTVAEIMEGEEKLS